MNTQTCTDRTEWDNHVARLGGHPLQLWGWGEVKASHNWAVERVLIEHGGHVIGGASVLLRTLPRPFGPLVYIARGPFCQKQDREAVLTCLKDAYRSRSPLALSVEPDWTDFPHQKGWKKTNNTILLARTGVTDLAKTEDELLSAMAKKTRQYIRKSEREALEIRPVVTKDEIDECLRVYKATAVRAGFALHDDTYYHDIFTSMEDATVLYGAWHEGRLTAFLWTVASRAVAFELYGGVTDEGQALRANYALKWRVMRECKHRGVERYDLNGLLNDGISNFKQGFIEHETELAGTYDYPMSPLYSIWTTLLPAAKRIVRAIKR